MRLALLLPAVLLITSATKAADQPIDAKDRAALGKELAGLTPRKPLACLPLESRRYTSTAYGPVIVYALTRGLVYVTRTTGGCEGAARGDTLGSVPYQTRGACSGDTIYTLHPVTHRATGSCRVGVIVPYTR